MIPVELLPLKEQYHEHREHRQGYYLLDDLKLKEIKGAAI